MKRGIPLGIVHRDMSPQNVMVGSDGVARVLDFGVAKVATRVDTTRQGIFKGKLAYASPEQVEGLPIDRRVDVFAASVVLWEMLTGRRLYKAESEVQLYTMVREGRIEHPSSIVGDLPEGLGWVVMKGLATDPNRRFSTALEMELALELVLPRASSRELAEWVKSVVPDALKARAQQLEAIEAASKPTTDSGVRELTMITTPLPPSVAPAIDASPRSRRRIVVASASFGALAIAAMLLLWRIGAGHSEPTKRAASVEEIPIAPAPKLPSPRATAKSAPVEAPATSPPPSPAPSPPAAAPRVVASSPPAPVVAPPRPLVAPPVAPSVAPRDAPPVAPPVAPTPIAKTPVSAAPIHSAAPAPTSHCTPPYTVDSDGIRHIKPECL